MKELSDVEAIVRMTKTETGETEDVWSFQMEKIVKDVLMVGV